MREEKWLKRVLKIPIGGRKYSSLEKCKVVEVFCEANKYFAIRRADVYSQSTDGWVMWHITTGRVCGRNHKKNILKRAASKISKELGSRLLTESIKEAEKLLLPFIKVLTGQDERGGGSDNDL